MKQPDSIAPEVHGHCDPRFAAVQGAFATNFVEDDEVGAALCIHIGGACVVDIWGGHVDADRTRRWQRDTLVNAYSVGKGVLAVLVTAIVESGALELDAPVASLWPEFAAGDKAAVSVRELMAHRAGLPAVRERLPEHALYDWPRMCDALASQVPYWEPDSGHGYHVNTYGYLVGELVRRATGLPVGDALARIVTGPLGAEFVFGLPRSEHHRVAETVVPDVQMTEPQQWARAFPATGDAVHDEMIWHAYFNPSGLSGMGTVNTEAWRLAAIPSANGHGTARVVAEIYAAFLAGGPPGTPWAGPGVRAEARTIPSDGEDRVLGRPSRFGLGFQLSQPSRPIGPGPRAFGHYGYGGSLGFADPDADLAFGYLMNHPGERWQSTRTKRLINAVYACL
ncbi:MAG: beta-lactamase family protein [Deltaproteobacteria bacterium]|nr:beta-lactamase family protein [Deltaproteobacteria bacterium]